MVRGEKLGRVANSLLPSGRGRTSPSVCCAVQGERNANNPGKQIIWRDATSAPWGHKLRGHAGVALVPLRSSSESTRNRAHRSTARRGAGVHQGWGRCASGPPSLSALYMPRLVESQRCSSFAAQPARSRAAGPASVYPKPCDLHSRPPLLSWRPRPYAFISKP